MPVETNEERYLQKIKRRHEEIAKLIYSNVTPIEGVVMRETEGFERYDEAINAPGYKPINTGDWWGGGLNSGWFKMSFELPKSFEGKPAVALVDVGFEGLVYLNGEPFHGIETWWHKEVLLAEKAEAGTRYDLVIEAMYNWAWIQSYRGKKAQFKQAEIATINREVDSYWYALGFLHALASALPEGSVRRARLIRGMNESVNAFDLDNTDEQSLKESAERAMAILKPLFDQKAEPSALTATCTGHSHIDVAWLWPYSETIRKCSRTFATALRMMERYPEYHFSQSQPQLYEFTKERWPELYSQIRERVKEGRWEPIGCMWVEADTNVPSGESLVRQCLFGKRFFMDEFGVETKVLWLPDVFGYSASLPQILKKSGVDYFTSIKLLWGNQFNRFPYSSFWWEGIDGSRVLAHFPPHGDYNTRVHPEQLILAQRNYKEKDRSNHILFQFGWGDGGGGPDRTHLENLKLAKDLEGLPRCVQRKGAEFFDDLAKEASTFPVWRGELYFELHRGTYTTQSKTKRINRLAELALRDAELLSSVAFALGSKYPQDAINGAWKLVLKNQFHDVIPGSSVPEVYVDAANDYEKAISTANDARKEAASFLASKIDTSGDGEALVVFNTLSWERKGIVSVQLPGSGRWSVTDYRGVFVPSQISKDGKSLSFTANVPAMGWAVYHLINRASEEVDSDITAAVDLLENKFYRIKLDSDGLIASVWDKCAGREVLPEGERANLFQLFDDRPNDFDAWDIDVHYIEKCWNVTDLEDITVDEVGPVYASIRLKRRFGGSSVDQRIVIYADVPRIDFITHANWNEKHKVLKVRFPANVNSETARYEVQFGSVERPTHKNTSWDIARFEVCGHKWADLSESGYGISLLNDCKYGYSADPKSLSLTILRAPTDPDPTADIGEHDLTYSLLPHQGDWVDAGVVQAGYELNVPLFVLPELVHEGNLPARYSVVELDMPNVILDTIKKAEDDESLIMRLYESNNKRGVVTITTELPIRKVVECDLMEREIGNVSLCEGAISFEIVPFEIKSVKLSV